MPASHAGVADVSSTHGQLSAMVWIEAIIESIVWRRQTAKTPSTLTKLGIPPPPLPGWVIAVIGLAVNSLQNPGFKELRCQNPRSKGVSERRGLPFSKPARFEHDCGVRLWKASTDVTSLANGALFQNERIKSRASGPIRLGRWTAEGGCPHRWRCAAGKLHGSFGWQRAPASG
jgi:hypothetical protein